MRICRVTTVPFFLLHHLEGQIRATIQAGHEVYLVSSASKGYEQVAQLLGGKFNPIEISRKISPVADFFALIALWRFFKKYKFDIIHSATPKAGLLCAIAGLLAMIPVRIHTFTGQPWMELSGWIRWLAKASDWLIAHLNTQCYADSKSQRSFLISEGIARPHQIKVLGGGSLGGVDAGRFNTRKWAASKKNIREELSIPNNAKVVTFIGRVTRDKGIIELVAAHKKLSTRFYELVLILVGPLEPPIPESVLADIHSNNNIRLIGYSSTPEKYLAVSDVFCLPSYREGFGNVVIEAAAMGVPTVATRIVGLVDAIVDKETGLLVPPKNSAALADALTALLEDGELKRSMGAVAKTRALDLFDAEVVNRLVLNEYAMLSRKGRHA